jgi:hypothetical protein
LGRWSSGSSGGVAVGERDIVSPFWVGKKLRTALGRVGMPLQRWVSMGTERSRMSVTRPTALSVVDAQTVGDSLT